MEKHFKLSDAEFENQFRSHSLDATLFTHEARLRLAWIYIHKYGIDKAIENLTTQFRQYVVALDANHKYNQKVTVVAVRAVYHFILKSKKDDFASFIAQHERLKYNFRELLSFHYITNIFKSLEVRETTRQPAQLSFD